MVQRSALSVLVAAVLLFAATGLPAGRVSDTAFAADGCADFDGDGFVHVVDVIIWSNYFGQTVPPAPQQVDLVKDGGLNAADFSLLFQEFLSSTACQTDPLPSTSLAGGALAVDADGEDTTAGDAVQSTRTVVLGETFHVTIQITSNPGIYGVQQRLHWDEGPLNLNARTAFENDLWVNIQPAAARFQKLGPPDEGSGNDAYIELGSTPFKTLGDSSTFVGPVAQFEFVCQLPGTANLTLDAAHSLFADAPSTEYKPAVTGAQIECVCPPEGCPVGGIAELPEVVARAPLEAPGSSGPSTSVVAGIVAAATAGAFALGGAAWYARRRRG